VLVHELGHFTAAKLCGVQVNEFALGLGPAIFKKKFGETTYAIRCLPIGGQCVMEGEDADTENPRAFTNAAKWKRFVILVSGAAMNFLTGFVIFLLLFLPVKTIAVPTISGLMDQFTGGDVIQTGDRLLSIDGYSIWLASDVSTALASGDDAFYDIAVRRDGARLLLKDVHIEPRTYETESGPVQYYGLQFEVEDLNFFGHLRLAWFDSLNMVRMVFTSLRDLFSGKYGINDLSGPVGITAVMSDAAKVSMSSFWYLSALIAINLAVMNLLPIPALDGGRILFLLIETIVRRPLNRNIEGIIYAVTFLLLMGLMAVVAFNDVWRLIS